MKNPSEALRIALLVCCLSFLFMAGCSREPQKNESSQPAVVNKEAHTTGSSRAETSKTEGVKRAPASQASDGVIVSASTLLATISDKESPPSIQVPPGHRIMSSLLISSQMFNVVFSEKGGGVAYSAQKGGKLYVVHNGKRGKPYQSIGTIALSPDGRRIAYSAMSDAGWHVVIDGAEGIPFEEVGEPLFSPDGRHVAYLAKAAGNALIVVDDRSKHISPLQAHRPLFTADSMKVVYAEQEKGKETAQVVLSDLDFKKRLVTAAGVQQFVANREKTGVAAVVADRNKQKVLAFRFDRPQNISEGPLYDGIVSLSVGPDGVSTAYIAEKGGLRLLILNGREEPLPAGDPTGSAVVRPDKRAAGVIMAFNNGFFLHQAFIGERTKEKLYDEAADLVYSRDSSMYAYAARKGKFWVIVVNGKEGPAFDRVLMPQFSPDGKLVVYRARKAGKRFVVVEDSTGKVLRQHPSYEQVLQPVFTADGKSVAYGVKDGQKLIWKVEGL